MRPRASSRPVPGAVAAAAAGGVCWGTLVFCLQITSSATPHPSPWGRFGCPARGPFPPRDVGKCSLCRAAPAAHPAAEGRHHSGPLLVDAKSAFHITVMHHEKLSFVTSCNLLKRLKRSSTHRPYKWAAARIWPHKPSSVHPCLTRSEENANTWALGPLRSWAMMTAPPCTGRGRRSQR